MKRWIASTAVLFALVDCRSAAAQEALARDLKATAEEVVLDLVVRDKAGHPVRDLAASEITILDNGKPRAARALRLIDGSEAIALAGGKGTDSAAVQGNRQKLNPLRQIRLVTLVFEPLGQDARRFARQAAQQFVATPPQNSLFSVMGVERRLRALQDFTADRTALKKAIDQATSGKVMEWASTSSVLERQLQQLTGPREGMGTEESTVLLIKQLEDAIHGTKDYGPNGAGVAGGDPIQAGATKLLAETLLRSIRFDEQITRDQSGRSTLESLRAIADAQRPLPGRKVILYFSEGLYIPSYLRDEFHNLISQANRASISIYALDVRGLRNAAENAKARDELNAAARASAQVVIENTGVSPEQRVGVTIEKAIYLDRGIESTQANLQSALGEMAESTGGFLIANTNDFRPALQQVNEELNTYYEAAYNPGIEQYDGSFHKVEVRLSRPGLKVQTRSGYYALPAAQGGRQIMAYEMPLLAALDKKEIVTGLPVYASVITVEPARAASAEAAMSAIIQAPLRNVKFTVDDAAKRYRARVSLLALIKDQKGNIVRRLSRDLPLEGGSELLDRVKNGYLIYNEPLQLTPGEYTMETALVDRESGLLTTRKDPFTVADPASLAMSSIVLVRRYDEFGKWAFDPADPFQYDGGHVTPTIVPVVSGKSAKFSVFFLVYPEKGSTAQATVRLEYLMDNEVFGGTDMQLGAPDTKGRIPAMVTASAGDLSPGKYKVRATLRQGNLTVTQVSDFEVQ